VKAREESLGVKLLLATREAFEAVGDPAALATNYLRLRVGADEHSAFYDWKGTGKPISAKAMAAILSGYGIDREPEAMEFKSPETGETARQRGYLRKSFEPALEAWLR
jgi:hypothetical protein